MNKNINLVLIAGFILFCQVKVCAQQYQVQSFIEYYPKWAGGSELLKFSPSDCVLIASADFSSIIKCEIKSSIRSRVEHVFGFMEGAMHGLTVRTIGMARAATCIFLKCLTYNMFRYEQFVRNGIR